MKAEHRPQTPEALIVFAKEPEAGEVKTRLQPPLSAEEAAELYRAFLDDSLEQYASLEADLWLYMAGTDVERWAGVYEGCFVRPQSGSDLGSRMSGAFRDLFGRGYERAVIVGSDNPTLPPSYIRYAFGELKDGPGMVIGPAYDGGYYLLGMNGYFPELFAGMTYSHGKVFDETLRRAAAHRRSVTVLPYWYDIDDAEGLQMLVRDVVENQSALPRVRSVLRRLVPRYPELFDPDQSGSRI